MNRLGGQITELIDDLAIKKRHPHACFANLSGRDAEDVTVEDDQVG